MADTHDVLRALLPEVSCKPGWTFRFESTNDGPRVVISIPVSDSRGGYLTRIDNHFAVPPTTWNARSWRRWLFECCLGVERHELGEWFRHGSERPFAPLHAPGEDPYTQHEFRLERDAHLDQAGNVDKAEGAPHFDAHGVLKHYCRKGWCPDWGDGTMERK